MAIVRYTIRCLRQRAALELAGLDGGTAGQSKPPFDHTNTVLTTMTKSVGCGLDHYTGEARSGARLLRLGSDLEALARSDRLAVYSKHYFQIDRL